MIVLDITCKKKYRQIRSNTLNKERSKTGQEKMRVTTDTESGRRKYQLYHVTGQK